LPDAEAMGLLALMLLQESRRDARTTPEGDLILLEDQDRTRWDRALLAEGDDALRPHPLAADSGPYRVQAEIAAVHVRAPDAAATDWQAIASLYGGLLRLTDSPVVALNHAVAVAFADGPDAGLALVDELAAGGRLDDYYLVPATRADLLRRLGRLDEALTAYRRALAGAPSAPEQAFLHGRIRELEATAPAGSG
jgi:RNA polymerase sigma-70 factor (ECF subfamily)